MRYKLNISIDEALVGDNLGFDKDGIIKAFDLGYETYFYVKIGDIPHIKF